jgi:hypothetical protein
MLGSVMQPRLISRRKKPEFFRTIARKLNAASFSDSFTP